MWLLPLIFTLIGAVGVWIGAIVYEEEEVYGIFVLLPAAGWMVVWGVVFAANFFCTGC